MPVRMDCVGRGVPGEEWVWNEGGGELGIAGVLEMDGVSIREEAELGRPVLKL